MNIAHYAARYVALAAIRLLVPALLVAQTPLYIAGWQPADGDTRTHIDLAIGTRVQLALIDGVAVNVPATWKSSNATVASVTRAGLLAARQKGYATISATYAGLTYTIRACVPPAGQPQLLFRTRVDSVRVKLRTEPLHVGESAPAGLIVNLSARDTTTTTAWGAWGPCVHWAILAPLPPRSYLHAPGKVGLANTDYFDVIAGIGTLMPWTAMAPGGAAFRYTFRTASR